MGLGYLLKTSRTERAAHAALLDEFTSGLGTHIGAHLAEIRAALRLPDKTAMALKELAGGLGAEPRVDGGLLPTRAYARHAVPTTAGPMLACTGLLHGEETPYMTELLQWGSFTNLLAVRHVTGPGERLDMLKLLYFRDQPTSPEQVREALAATPLCAPSVQVYGPERFSFIEKSELGDVATGYVHLGTMEWRGPLQVYGSGPQQDGSRGGLTPSRVSFGF